MSVRSTLSSHISSRTVADVAPRHSHVDFNKLELWALLSLFTTVFCAIIFLHLEAPGLHRKQNTLTAAVLLANLAFLTLFLRACSTYVTRRNLQKFRHTYVSRPCIELRLAFDNLLAARRAAHDSRRRGPISAMELDQSRLMIAF